MDIRQAIQAAAQDPRFQQALQVAQQELSDASPEQIDELIKLFEFVMEHPDKYAQIRQSAIADGMVEAEDMPEQFDGTMIASVLVVLYQLRQGGGQQQQFAGGGLARMRTLARQGRHGDTMLAHISPEEAAMLKMRGGAGTINPQTGLPQYFSLGKLFKAVLPIALTFIAPGLGTAIGTALGASGTAAAMLGSAVLGAGGSALTGGNVLQGALFGGLMGGFGSAVGGAANNALGLGLGQAGQAVLGSGLVGGLAGAATGQGFAKGALQGAGGAYLGQAVGGLGGDAFKTGGNTFGNMMAAGYDPKTAALGGTLSGLASNMLRATPANTNSGLGLKSPSDAALGELRSGPMTSDLPGSEGAYAGSGLQATTPPIQGGELSRFGTTNFITGEQGVIPGTAPNLGPAPVSPAGFDTAQDIGSGLKMPASNPISQVGTTPAPTGILGTNVSPMQALALAGAASSLAGAPPAAQAAVKQMSPEQQAYFNRPNISWDWDKMQRDASAAGMDLGQYMAQSWPQITGGTYDQIIQRKARGGALNSIARMARGAGSGRDDTIDAKLSDGEYVMDAETVALLGDGSTDEGARRLDAMREQLRRQKGKALAKGKFSPNAKSPLAYLKGVA
jgi:hypothetical protein